jgi:L-2-hydroxyglutarate oxidase LhgO
VPSNASRVAAHEIDEVDVAIVGGGVVGLAIARTLALRGAALGRAPGIVLLEAEAKTGMGISSRSSEVVHAGLYYPTDSLRARLCVAGREALYRYCEAHAIPHRRTGKLIVATANDQLDQLGALQRKAHDNAVTDVVALDAREIRRVEPALAGVGALWSPSTGIVDSHALMEALRREATEAGVAIVCRTRVVGGHLDDDESSLTIRLATDGEGASSWLRARCLVNAAGLGAQELALGLRGLEAPPPPARHLVKGSYFRLEGVRAPFSRLVYPLPEPGGLGVHLTLDLAGQARFGPDVEWIDREEYTVDPRRADGFYASIRRYWPGLPDGALVPDYAGIRPKISARGAPPADFSIAHAPLRGRARDTVVPGYVGLFGIESPGLTCCLALADEVVDRLLPESGGR